MRYKYGAKKTEYKGMKFDSKLEAKFYQRLEMEKKAGVITDFQWQVPIPLYLPLNFEFEWKTDDEIEIYDALRMIRKRDKPYMDYTFLIMTGKKLTKTKKVETFDLNEEKMWVVSHKRGKESWLVKLYKDKVLTYSAKKMFTYVCDFVIRNDEGVGIYLDTKGYRTPIYKLKKKMIESNYEVKICEAEKVTSDISDFFCD